MQRVVVLGGAGDIGSRTVEALLRYRPHFKERLRIIIADYDLSKAKRKAKEWGLEVLKTDIYQEDSLLPIMEGADVAVNCVGPFYQSGPPVAKTAIKTKTNLIDVCDDPKPTEEILTLEKDATEAGVSLLTNLGWTPGISNILAKEGAGNLDKVKVIKISWAGGASDSEGLAVIEHVLLGFTEKAPCFVDKKLHWVNPATEEEKVDFPSPIGSLPVFQFGHPEPITIPKYIEADTVISKGALFPYWNNQFGRWLARRGWIETEEGRRKVAKAIHTLEGIFRLGGKPVSGLRVDISGVKDGEAKTLRFATVDNMAKQTGISAAIAVWMLLEDRISQKGVFPPEGCIDPHLFLKELEETHGVKVIRF